MTVRTLLRERIAMNDTPDEKLTEAEWAARLHVKMRQLEKTVPKCVAVSLYPVGGALFGAIAWAGYDRDIAEGEGMTPIAALDELARVIKVEEVRP